MGTTLTLRRIALSMVSLFVLAFVIACGGGDDNDDVAPTATIATNAASPTATADDSDDEAAGAASPTTGGTNPSGSASPTAEATREASPTRDTSRPVATRAPEPTPTEVDESGDLATPTAEEEALLGLLLTEEDLPDGWIVESADVAEDEDAEDGDQICGAGSFPQRDQKIAEVEAEYAFDSAEAPLFLLQNIVEFPQDVAVDAMDWAREASSCTEWTDDEGTTIQVAPLESPGLGDDSHAVRFTFDAGDGQIVVGDWVFIRVGGMIATIAYLGQEDADLAPFYDIMVTATEKLQSAGTGTGAGPDIDPEVQAILEEMLLTQEDMPVGWTLLSSGPGEEDNSETAFCNVPDFPLKDTRFGDAEAEFEVDPSIGPFLNQQIAAFPDDVVLDAMDYARETLSCSEWTDEETGFVFTVNPAYDPEVGEDSVAISFTFETPDGITGEGEAFFVRVGNFVMAVTAISIEPLGFGEVVTITHIATEKIETMLQ